MRRHRRTAGLNGAIVALAAAVGALALIVPWIRDSPPPNVGDVAVGWGLLAAACVAGGRRPTLALTMLAAGVVWIAAGVAPLFGGPVPAAIARLALAPTALVVIAVGMIAVGERPARGLWLVTLSVSAITAIGAAGAFRFATAAFGVCLLVLSGSSRPEERPAGDLSPMSRDRMAARWIGAGLLGVGLCSSLELANATFVTNLYELVIVVAAGIVAWYVFESRPTGGDPVRGALANALSDALGRNLVAIAFPSTVGASRRLNDDLTWLDPAGVECRPADAGGPVCSREGVAIAWLSPPIEPGDGDSELLRLLDVAGDVARLRAQLCASAAEIERSTERLATAADGERARLAAMLESGPLAALDRVAELIDRAADPDLPHRVDAANRALRGVVDGIEPVDPGDGLTTSLERLATRFGATWEINDAADDLPPQTARLIWFACAEGLANAAKHAVGAPVSLALTCRDERFELRVVDRGGGGADGNGPGLARLTDRVVESGATLTIESPVGGGTCLTMAGPSIRQAAPDNVPALMTGPDSVETMAT
jgi:hypothetical protein